jgi:hypothetical protein
VTPPVSAPSILARSTCSGSVFLVDSSTCTVLQSACDVLKRCIVQSVVICVPRDNSSEHVIVGIYKHPDASLTQILLPLLSTHVRNCLKIHPLASVTVMGDWNVDLLSGPHTLHGNSVRALETFMQQSLHPRLYLCTPKIPTHDRGGMLDHTWSFIQNGCFAAVGTSYYSDHDPVFTALPLQYARTKNLLPLCASPYFVRPSETGIVNTTPVLPPIAVLSNPISNPFLQRIRSRASKVKRDRPPSLRGTLSPRAQPVPTALVGPQVSKKSSRLGVPGSQTGPSTAAVHVSTMFYVSAAC